MPGEWQPKDEREDVSDTARGGRIAARRNTRCHIYEGMMRGEILFPESKRAGEGKGTHP